MYGQYDKMITIQFHKFSPAVSNFGRSISGVISYGKKERAILEKTITSDHVSKTNGIVRTEVAATAGLSAVAAKMLVEQGFYASDIYEISTTNGPSHNAYLALGEKKISDTIEIEVDFSNVDLLRLTLLNIKNRMNEGCVLIESEWDQYFGYQRYYFPHAVYSLNLEEKVFLPDGKLKSAVRFYELKARYGGGNSTPEERAELLGFLRSRKTERFIFVEAEIKRCGIKSMDEFKVAHAAIYHEILSAAFGFDDEVLTFSMSQIPVYWDFRSYIHIVLRHCADLQPNGHFKMKTPFPYNKLNIRRVLNLAIKKLEGEIEIRLSQGLDFRVFGEKALYFNGNYYSIRIEKDGRVDTFYPNQ